MKINREEFLDILDHAHDKYDWVAGKYLDSKHSAVYFMEVFRDKETLKLYGVEYWQDYNYGIESDEFDVFEVKEILSPAYRKIS